MRWRLGAAVLLLVAATLVLGRGWMSRLVPGLGARNLLVVSIDTLRADHLGSYGYAAAATPALDALAARGLRFDQAATVMPLTLPAHSSLMTGTFTAFHGVRDNGGFYLDDDQQTLAETLRAQGYRTGGFVGAFVLDSRWGIHQGFERYFDDFDLSKYEGLGMDAVQRRGDEVVAKAEAWLAQERSKPFFAWVHLYDPHTPYDAPEPYRSRFPATITGAYDAEIAWADALVGRLLGTLAADGRLARTIVVVVGDHGESLGDHGERTHGFFLYDATLRIPLIVAGPGVPVRAVKEQVRIVDVMPTALDLLGVAIPAPVQGKSLMPLGRGESLGLVALSESWYPRYHYGWSELVAVRDGQYKFIQAPRRELYALARDPAETQDLAGSEAPRAEALERTLKDVVARYASRKAHAGPQSIDAEAEERLEALGYVAGSVSQRSLEDRPRGDPKDKIELYNLLKDAGGDAIEDRLDEAIAKVRQALDADPEIVEGHTLLGGFEAKAKRYEPAAAAYRRALAMDPEHQGALYGLASAYKELGRLEDAEAGFERARQLDPRNGRVLYQLADVWMRRGSLDRAEALLKEALAKKVDEPRFTLKLGECYVEMKRYADAEAALRRTLALRPDMKTAHYNLGLVLEATGHPDQAMAEYEVELQQNSKAFRASFNLAKLLLRAGRSQEAVARFRQAIESEPDFGTGYLYLAKALLDAGDLAGAQDSVRRGLDRHPEKGTAPLGHYVLADVYTRLGRPRDAERELAAAQKAERGG